MTDVFLKGPIRGPERGAKVLKRPLFVKCRFYINSVEAAGRIGIARTMG
ncbi:MAG: hypothetical protein ACYCR2_11825 [Thermoplasmataceae archaeon]